MVLQVLAIIVIVGIVAGIVIRDKIHGEYDISTYEEWKKENNLKDL